MAEVTLTVAGRAYRLACRDDEEPALRTAARAVDARATQLADNLGAVSEGRLLLMTALSFAGGGETATTTEPVPDQDALRLVAERLENIATHLEQAAEAH